MVGFYRLYIGAKSGVTLINRYLIASLQWYNTFRQNHDLWFTFGYPCSIGDMGD